MVDPSYAAFHDDRLVARGPLSDFLALTKAYLDCDASAQLLIFEAPSGKQVEFNFQGTLAEVQARASARPGRAGPGRPKLGVVSRELSLLPRHWEWLEQQPQGISATVRRLVDEAKKREPGAARTRAAREAASRFMTAMAGNRPHYEEASRALFAGDESRFRELIQDWPRDVREHLLELLRGELLVGVDGP